MGDNNRDQSMEEILASIKRVISEDVPPAAPRPRAGRAARDEDVLELNDAIDEGESLLSQNSAEASRSRLAALAELRRPGEVPAGGDGALEAVVREMLKPMLKDWLDRHLPEIVEQLVQREIARITGKDG